MPAPYVGFRAIDRLEADLTARGGDRLSIGGVAQRDLERYYDALRRALPVFSEREARLLCEVANGPPWQPHATALLWAEVADAVRDGDLGAKWGVDGEALVRRLRNELTAFERLAIVDAVERYWRLAGGPEAPPHGEALRRVGLVR